MNDLNIIDENFLLLERPNLRMECNISDSNIMNNYLILYSVYNILLIQFLMKEYYLKDVDEQLAKRVGDFIPISKEMMDLYQYSSLGFLKYFYLRNNIYIERLSDDDKRYLFEIYNSGNYSLNEERENFIRRTYLNTILEYPNNTNRNFCYGPDNRKFIKPGNAIIIGVRYDQFSNMTDDTNVFNVFAKRTGQIQILSNFLEYKIKSMSSIPFYVIEYDEFSVNCKKKMTDVIAK